MVLPLEFVFKLFGFAMAFGLGFGIILDLFMYGVSKCLHLINIKI